MEARVQQLTDGTRLLRIDIDTWGSPVADQFGIRSLPTLQLYEGKGLVSSDTREVIGLLNEAR